MKPELMEGSEAMARAAVAAGCRFFAGYPMTPFTEVLENLARLLPDFPRARLELYGSYSLWMSARDVGRLHCHPSYLPTVEAALDGLPDRQAVRFRGNVANLELLRELGAELVEVESGDLLVELLRQRVHAEGILLGLLPKGDLGEHLVRERVRHHERRVTRGIAQV